MSQNNQNLTQTAYRAQTATMSADISANDTAWGVLYNALVSTLNVDPSKFQLLYPMVSWDWPSNNLGFTNSAQYNFCSTIPQWSATGAYVSSGDSYDQHYQQFLNAIMLDTSNPTILAQITAAQNNLTQDSANYQSLLNQAKAAYASDNSVVNNVPTYTNWLTGDGFSYGTQLTAAQNQLQEDQAVLAALVKEQNTPNIANAQAAMQNPNNYTKLSDTPSLSPVPAWNLAKTAQQWVNMVNAHGGTGNSITISNSSTSSSYSGTWAQGSASVDEVFWQVQVNGSWSKVSEFYSDSSLSCTISFAAWDTIGITPGQWNSGTTAFQNGPFTMGYTATKPASGTGVWMFGEGGLVPAYKTAMLVCYQPTITINVSAETYKSFQQDWQAAVGIQVGPFQIDGSASGSTLDWSQSGSGYQLVVKSTSTTPLIFGVNIALQPNPSSAPSQAQFRSLSYEELGAAVARLDASQVEHAAAAMVNATAAISLQQVCALYQKARPFAALVAGLSSILPAGLITALNAFMAGMDQICPAPTTSTALQPNQPLALGQSQHRSLSYEELGAAVARLDVSQVEHAAAAMVNATTAISLQQVCTLYQKFKPYAALVVALPILPAALITALKAFLAGMDQICPAPTAYR